MNRKQIIAIFAPLLLTGIMYPVFQYLAGVFGERLGWYFGLVIYWLVWGAAFSAWMIGKKNIWRIIRPQRLTFGVAVLVLFPVLMSALYRLAPGMEYEKPSFWVLLMLISTTIGNGFFEEVLWRGVYMTLFPENNFLRIVWPSIWFAIWHYAPGSVSTDGNVWGLIIGAAFFGFYLSFLAKKTGTIWWSILAHFLGGIVMIF
ncbi:MAG: CPBP family intramembrane metalloprotease [Anaerolineales bacterium]|nr:CPBP family intramembrane metalloprotease [Chloroflexota bacterium]MBL6979654.1 CPBP family intramembrane metalloprotease [Anaerolineales bacterium]